MAHLENFAQQYAAQHRAAGGDYEPAQAGREHDAAQIDAILDEQLGTKPGDSKSQREVKEETGKAPGEPETPMPERLTEDSIDEAAATSQQVEQGPDTVPSQHTEADSEPASVAEFQPADGDPAQVTEHYSEDSVPADAAVFSEETLPGIEPNRPVEETIAEKLQAADTTGDTTELPISVQMPAARTVELIPPNFPDKVREAFDRMPLGGTEISFSETPMELPEIPDMGIAVSTMLSTDAQLSGLPFLNLFGDRSRDQ